MVSLASYHELKRRIEDDVAFTGGRAAVSTASVSSLLRRTVLHHNAGAAMLTRIQVVRLAPHVIFTPNPGIFT